MCVTICERFFLNGYNVADYANRIRAKWNVQIAGMFFTRFKINHLNILKGDFTLPCLVLSCI